MSYGFKVVVYDLEMVRPETRHKTGLFDKNGNFKEDQYQIFSSRIWQIALVAQNTEFSRKIHPGFDINNLSKESRDFLDDEDYDSLCKMEKTNNMESMWFDLSNWLLEVSQGSALILVAQQAQRNDEIVLAIEMARHNLKWPCGLTIYGLDPLKSVRKTLTEHVPNPRRIYAVQSIYEELTGTKSAKSHSAIEDAHCLTKTLMITWAMKFMGNLGMRCTESHIPLIAQNVRNVASSFWTTVADVLQWKDQLVLLKDHKVSLWSLATRMYSPWNRALVEHLETRHDIYTLDDLEHRCESPEFIEVLRQNPHWDVIREEIKTLHN